MKKLLTILVLAFALCMLCGVALAGTYTGEFDTIAQFNAMLLDPQITIDGRTIDNPGTKFATNYTTAQLNTMLAGNKHATPIQVEVTGYQTGTTKPETIVVWVKNGPHAKDYAHAVTDATCTTPGTVIYPCTHANCDYKFPAEPGVTLGHAWAEVDTWPNGCTAPGVKTFVCVRCGESRKKDDGTEYSEALAPKPDHTWGTAAKNGVIVTVEKPHCLKGNTNVQPGKFYEKCSVCGYEWRKTTGYTYVDGVQYFYGADGYFELTLAQYNAYVGVLKAIDGHTWGDWYNEKDATCAMGKAHDHRCTVCGKTETVEYPAPNPKLTAKWVPEEGTTCADDPIYFVCEYCLKNKTTTHVRTAGTDKQIAYAPNGLDQIGYSWKAPDGSRATILHGYKNNGNPSKWSYDMANYATTATTNRNTWTTAQKKSYCEQGAIWQPVKCETCGNTTILLNAASHTWTAWEKHDDNSPVELWSRYCTFCKTVETRTYHPCEKESDHDFQVPAEVFAALKCNEKTNVAKICTKCGEEKYADVTREHNLVKYGTTVAATCTTAGKDLYKCSYDNCDYLEEKEVEATGHKLTLVPGKEATHTATGLKDSYKCYNCGKLFLTEADALANIEVTEAELVIAKTPEHDWDKAKVEIVKEATCKEAGKKLLTCECGATKTIAIPMIAHTPVEIPAVEPTCKTVGATAGKKCSACGTVLEAPVEIPVDATKHVWGEVVTTKAPTCEKAGAGLKVCTVCKTSEEVVIPATGHDWGEWEVTTPATVEKDGEATRVCKNDATHKETKPVKYEATDPAKYEVKVDYSKPKATGTVELDPHTKALTKAYARVTFFLANGDCMIQIVEVKDGKFTAGAEGNFTHVSVIIVDDAEAYGAEEAIEHAHGNGGIEL